MSRRGPVEHKAYNAPLETYVNRPYDKTRQRSLDEIHKYVHRQVAEENRIDREQAAEAGIPLADWPKTKAKVAAVQRFVDFVQSNRTPDWQLMRWRVRLLCGHIIETTAHVSNDKPSSTIGDSLCDTCGDGKRYVHVAWEPLGLKSERPPPPGATKKPPPARRKTKADLGARVRELEAEVRRLKSE